MFVFAVMKGRKVVQDFSRKAEQRESPHLQTRSDVATWIGVPEKSIRYFLYGRRVENLYMEFEISKKSNGCRHIRAPYPILRSVQRKLADALMGIFEPRDCVYGFVQNRNIIGNAQKHVKNRCILNIDLKDFFDQIHIGRVIGMLMSEPYAFGKEAATVIAQLVCYYKKDSSKSCLPQGAPTSPVISNMICSSMDTQMMRFAKKHHLIYTRYADDITFSTNKKHFGPEIAFIDAENNIILSKELRGIFLKASFVVNEEKLRLRSQFYRQEVTGLVVNKKVNVKREYVKQIRSILHHCEIDGLHQTALAYLDKQLQKKRFWEAQRSDPSFMENYLFAVVKGKLSFLRQVRGENDDTFLRYAEQANRLFQDTENGKMFDLSYANLRKAVLQRNVFVIHSFPIDSDETTQGSCFYVSGFGMITSYHVTENSIFFHAYTPDKFPDAHVDCLMHEGNCSYSDKSIDYAIYDVNPKGAVETLVLGDSTALSIGDSVTIAGFPNFTKGSSINMQKCELTESTQYMGSLFWKVNGRIVHGTSGGIVLNERVEVVGIVKGGIVSMSDDDGDLQGFVPIHCVLQDIERKKNLTDSSS